MFWPNALPSPSDSARMLLAAAGVALYHSQAGGTDDDSGSGLLDLDSGSLAEDDDTIISSHPFAFAALVQR